MFLCLGKDFFLSTVGENDAVERGEKNRYSELDCGREAKNEDSQTNTQTQYFQGDKTKIQIFLYVHSKNQWS